METDSALEAPAVRIHKEFTLQRELRRRSSEVSQGRAARCRRKGAFPPASRGMCYGPARLGESSPSSPSIEAHLIHSGIARLVRLFTGEMSQWTENEFGVRKM